MIGLCFRCEHRALWHETAGAHRPRHECGEWARAVGGCYMFLPVRPCVLARSDGDTRPIAASWMLAARSRGVEVCDCETVTTGDPERYVIYHRPKRTRKRSAAVKRKG